MADSARSRSGLGADDMLAATTKQDCRDSRSPRARPLIAVGTLLVYAFTGHGGPVAASQQDRLCDNHGSSATEVLATVPGAGERRAPRTGASRRQNWIPRPRQWGALWSMSKGAAYPSGSSCSGHEGVLGELRRGTVGNVPARGLPSGSGRAASGSPWCWSGSGAAGSGFRAERRPAVSAEFAGDSAGGVADRFGEGFGGAAGHDPVGVADDPDRADCVA